MLLTVALEKHSVKFPANVNKQKFCKWTAQDVGSWVESLESGNLKKYAKNFREKRVDGAELSNLTIPKMDVFFKEDLKIEEAGDRVKLLLAVEKMTGRSANKPLPSEDRKDEALPSADNLLTSQQGHLKNRHVSQLAQAAGKDDDYKETSKLASDN